MLDINFIRSHPKLVREAFRKRKVNISVENLLKIDEKRRKLIQEIEKLRKEKNAISRTGKETNLAQAREIKEALKKKEPLLKKTEEELSKVLLSLPNIPDPEVPPGEGEEDNKVIRKWGEPPKFDFTPKGHLELGKTLDILDIERGVKVSGSGFYYLKNEGALMEMALMEYTIHKLIEKGFQFLLTPDLVKERAMVGTGFFPIEKDEVYQIERDQLYLVGTAEVPLASYRSDEILDENELPLRYTAFSSCFRREAGSYGKETRGVFRVHQFNKVEMFVISRAEDSEQEHQKLVTISEEIMQELKIPYEIVINCLGDLGFPNRKRYDLNAWMPYWNAYRETHSASNDSDFQARRLNIRYRTKKGEIKFCHTLNNTALASPRIMVALLENYQRRDGSVAVPEVLYPYLKFRQIKPKP